jgi:hypothetical protein
MKRLLIIFLLMFLARATSAHRIDDLARSIKATVRVTENFPTMPLGCTTADGQVCFAADLLLENIGDKDYANTHWRLYMPWIHRIVNVTSPDFDFEHITGIGMQVA